MYKIDKNILSINNWDINGDILTEMEYSDYLQKVEDGMIEDGSHVEYIEKFTNESFSERVMNILHENLVEDELDWEWIKSQIGSI